MEGSLRLALATLIPESVSDGDESAPSHDDGDEADVLPDQPESTVRQTVAFGADQGYDFLPRPLRLVVDAAPGCGGVAWPAALVLARYLCHVIQSDVASFANASVVELGSGTGILSLALAMCLPRPASTRIVATDLDFLVPLISENVVLNGLQDVVEATPLPWGQDVPVAVPRRPDVILVADCVYFEPAFPLLVDTLCRLSAAREKRSSQRILFCYQKRRKADRRFFTLLKKHFSWDVVDDPSKALYSRKPLYLYSLHRKSP